MCSHDEQGSVRCDGGGDRHGGVHPRCACIHQQALYDVDLAALHGDVGALEPYGDAAMHGKCARVVRWFNAREGVTAAEWR